jgi:SAM-dependent methyltransferase
VRVYGDIAGDLAVTIAVGHKLMHSAAADVDGCPRCGLLRRDPSAVPRDLVDRYAADEYNDTDLWRLLCKGREEMRRDELWLRASGLEAGRRIVEIGSYAGALLAIATRIGCRALGVDVGRETSSFARSRGHTVVTGTFDDQVTPSGSLDGVFVMNCFEQLPDPRVTLLDLRRALRRGGSLLIRTPNADVVRRAHDPHVRATATRGRPRYPVRSVLHGGRPRASVARCVLRANRLARPRRAVDGSSRPRRVTSVVTCPRGRRRRGTTRADAG